MKHEDLLELVQPRWRNAFLTFIDSGEAEKGFLEYLDNDPDCQKAVDAAFSEQAAAFESLVQSMAGGERTQTRPAPAVLNGLKLNSATKQTVAGVAVATALEEVLQLPPNKQYEAVRQAASVLDASADVKQKETLKDLVQSLAAGL